MKIDRRKFFKTVGTGTAALGLGSMVPLSSYASPEMSAKDDDDSQILFIGDDIALRCRYLR